MSKTAYEWIAYCAGLRGGANEQEKAIIADFAAVEAERDLANSEFAVVRTRMETAEKERDELDETWRINHRRQVQRARLAEEERDEWKAKAETKPGAKRYVWNRDGMFSTGLRDAEPAVNFDGRKWVREEDISRLAARLETTEAALQTLYDAVEKHCDYCDSSASKIDVLRAAMSMAREAGVK